MVEPNARSAAEGLELALQKQWNRTAMVEYAQARTWEVVAREVESYLLSRTSRLGICSASDGNRIWP